MKSKPQTYEGWTYNELLPAILVDADVNKTRMFRDTTGPQPGGYQKDGVKPFEVIINSGQSNAAGSYSGGDTKVDPRCLAWNATFRSAGDQLVTAEADKPPFAKQNMGLQAGRAVAKDLDCVVVVLNIAKGNTPIENWLVGPKPPSPDMYGAIKAEVEAMFAFAGVSGDDATVDALLFTQGGSNEKLTSLTLELRASSADPVKSWASGFLEMRNRFMAEVWWGDETKIILGEGGFGKIDRFNSGIAYILSSGRYQGIYTIDNRFEPTQKGDDYHFSGESLTRIGQKMAKVYVSPKSAKIPNVIDQPCTLPLSDFDQDIAAAYQYLSRFEFKDDGAIALELTQDLDLEKVIKLRGISKEVSRHIIIRSQLTGVQGAGEAEDFTGKKPQDEATMAALYCFKIQAGTNRAFEVSGAVLNLEDILITSDGTHGRDLIDIEDGELTLHNVTLFGADGRNGSLIDGKRSIITVRDISTTGEGMSPVCLAYGRGADNKAFRKGGAIGADDCRVILPNAVITQMAFKAVIASQYSTCDFRGATFQDVRQSAIVLNDFSRAITTDTIYKNVKASAETAQTGSSFV